MPSRPNRLAFLLPLLLLRLTEAAQATPVRSDQAKLETEIEVVADISGAAQPTVADSPSLISLSAPESSRPPAANPARTVMLGPARQTRDSEPTSRYPADERHSPFQGFSTATSEPDPLARTLRSLVNVSHRSSGAAPTPVSNFARGDSQISIDIGDEGRAAILEVKEFVADAVRTVLDPHADEEGRITFSLAGIDGFRISNDGSSWSLGFGDSVLTSFQGNAREGEATAYQQAQRAAYLEDSYIRSRNLGIHQSSMLPEEIMQAIEDAKEITENPLTWFLITLFLLFRIAVKLVAARASIREKWRAKRRRKSRRTAAGHSSPDANRPQLDSNPAQS